VYEPFIRQHPCRDQDSDFRSSDQSLVLISVFCTRRGLFGPRPSPCWSRYASTFGSCAGHAARACCPSRGIPPKTCIYPFLALWVVGRDWCTVLRTCVRLPCICVFTCICIFVHLDMSVHVCVHRLFVTWLCACSCAPAQGCQTSTHLNPKPCLNPEQGSPTCTPRGSIRNCQGRTMLPLPGRPHRRRRTMLPLSQRDDDLIYTGQVTITVTTFFHTMTGCKRALLLLSSLAMAHGYMSR
jgi:hypothetical protein